PTRRTTLATGVAAAARATSCAAAATLRLCWRRRRCRRRAVDRRRRRARVVLLFLTLVVRVALHGELAIRFAVARVELVLVLDRVFALFPDLGRDRDITIAALARERLQLTVGSIRER